MSNDGSKYLSSFPSFSTNPELYLGRHRSELNPAEWMYECIMKEIRDFESELSPDTEIGCRLVAFGNTAVYYIDSIGYRGPDLLTFFCQDGDGQKATLLQHVTQVNVLLLRLPKRQEHETARRIGFTAENT